MHHVVRRTGRAAIHPFLAAAYPILLLYTVNLQEFVPPRELFWPLTLAIAGTALALLAIWGVVLRNVHSAALATTVLVALFFTYGMAWDAVGELLTGHAMLLAVWLLLAVAGMWLVLQLGTRAASITPMLNLVFVGLIAFNLAGIVRFQTGAGDGPALEPPLDSPAATLPATATLPDIYWIILDRYGSPDVVRDYYDHDISPFVDALRERGFYVAEAATANYLKTAPSLVWARNMTYLDGEVLRDRAAADHDWGPVHRDLARPFAVLDLLRQHGYRFIYSGTYWGPTATHPEADLNLVWEGGRSEFATVLTNTTLLRATELLGPEAPLDWRRERYELTRYQWDRLEDLAASGGGAPRFIHSHFALPHDPYVFHADGSFVPEDVERERSTAENYADQVEYANAAALSFIDAALDTSPERQPIIILQSEEGPWPQRYRAGEVTFAWADEATDAELHEKFGVLSAFHLPGVRGEEAEEIGFYQSVSLVNQFRIIFNAYFGTDFELLPDRSFVWPHQRQIYELIDVTDRVQAAIRAARAD
jgi:hypothetical protein